MKIEKAYSLDCDEVIDVELAYDYFWAGKISDKRRFVCAEEQCEAKITAANLDKLRQNMAVDPYFGSKEEHSDDCPLRKHAEEKLITPTIRNGSITQGKGRKNENLPDVFGLTRPASHFEKKVTTHVTDTVNNPSDVRRRKKRTYTSSSVAPSTYYSVMSFVSKYRTHVKAGVAETKYINAKGYDVSYSEMFVEIGGQLLENLSKHPRIYFAKAFINKTDKGDYTVRFASSFKIEEQDIRPSFFVSGEMIERAFSKNLSLKKFEELSKQRSPSVWAFVYGKPFKRVKNGKIYINLSIDSMDLFDYRTEFL